MGIYVPLDIDEQYRALYAYRAGYLPRDRKKVDAFLRQLDREVKAAPVPREKWTPSVQAMIRLIESDGIVRMHADQMIEQQYRLHSPDGKPFPKVASVHSMLLRLNHIITRAPYFNEPHFPVSSLFTYLMMTPAGESIFRNAAFNDSLREVLKEWCAYLDSKKSLSVITTKEKPPRQGWLSTAAIKANKLYEFVIPNKKAPHWGFKSFNAYFHREIKASERPIADPGNPKVIVSANDGTAWKIASKVRALDRFWIKGQPYSLANMLDNHYVDRFVGGHVFQSFLSGANYHRWHSPIDGVVRFAKVVPGLMFSDAESAGWDDQAGVLSQGYEASVNTRGLVFIESPVKSIGMVCVIPIGITEISSVRITVKKDKQVKKGDEIGRFSYGGSTLAVVFQPGAIRKFTVAVNDPINVNSQIAWAR